MEFVTIAGTKMRASRIALGTWAMGGSWWGGADDEQSVRTIRTALDQGINLIDTAPVYGWGRSEEIVGRALREHGGRDKVLLATKAGLEPAGKEIRRNSSRQAIQRELEDSLRRLGVDYIDLYQVHWPDLKTPIEETAGTFCTLYEQGKIGAIGVSNYSPEQMARFRKASPLHTDQPPYNLFERGIEHGVLPYCREHGLTTLMYGSLCRGLLSGRMRVDTKFEDDDLRQTDPKFQPSHYQQYLRAVTRLDRFAQENYGKRVLHLAIRWVLDQPGSDVALWGARRPNQLDPVKEILGWHLDAAALQAIDGILRAEVKEEVGPEFMAPPE